MLKSRKSKNTLKVDVNFLYQFYIASSQYMSDNVSEKAKLINPQFCRKV